MLIIRAILFQYHPECLLLSNYTKKSDMDKNTIFKNKRLSYTRSAAPAENPITKNLRNSYHP